MSGRVDTQIDYSFHIRPILSDRCFTCHGPDQSKVEAGLQLNSSEFAFLSLAEPGEPNYFALVPGDPQRSEVWRRISTDHLERRMPPVSSNKKPLSAEEQELIRKWIEQGAKYKDHWAFVRPIKPEVPKVTNQAWVRNPIDAFILASLEKHEIDPSPQADDETLIRRLSFDLTGLPPTPEAIDTFLEDERADRYERLVDRLLASDHYGERLALDWLDAARYADTNATHIDMARTSWPWRDWVIRAFNENKPYDAFVIEQLAGDLLPEATLNQKIATSFNRNHPISNEGGIIPEEFLVEYAADRVHTVGMVFMGLTTNCARCHDHKYDPFSMDDYYSLMSFFNSVDGEMGLEVQNEYAAYAYAPAVEVWEPEDQAEYERNKAFLKKVEDKYVWNEKITAALDNHDVARPVGWNRLIPANQDPNERRDQKPGNAPWEISIGNIHDVRERHRDMTETHRYSFHFHIPADPNLPPANLIRLEIPQLHTLADLVSGYGFAPSRVRSLKIELVADQKSHEVKSLPIRWSWASDWREKDDTRNYLKMLDDDHESVWEVDPTDRPFTMLIALAEPLQSSEQHKQVRISFDFATGGTLFPQQANLLSASLPDAASPEAFAPFSPLALIRADERAEWQQQSLAMDWHEANESAPDGLQRKIWRLMDRQFGLKKTVVRCMVMKEMDQPRETYVLARGQYDLPDKDRPRGRQIPAVFGQLPEDAPANRLGLAQWLVSPENPLTARVTVNRYWQMIFGVGLVKTAEDFGFQGEIPSHPQLLDFLSVDFQEQSWNVKHLIRLMVTSATYRQDSRRREALEEIDPENRLLAYSPRYRYQGEVIRDSALAASGLLVDSIGGPSVKPYQPPGLWIEKAMQKNNSTGRFIRDEGDKLYRRSMYTFWKQAAPPPQMETFDAPAREVCMVRRSRTNTPLQALVLQNDETYLEISRKLAEQVMLGIPGDWDATLTERLQQAFRLLTGRRPDISDLKILREYSQTNYLVFSEDAERGNQFLSYGESAIDESLDRPELAAFSLTVSTILNLDETITRN